MAKKTILELTDREIEALIDILETIESMYGCSEPLNSEDNDWDTDMKREIGHIDKMLKRNGYTRA